MRTVLAFLFASIACCAQSGHLKSFAEYSFVEKGEVFQAPVRANPGDWIEVKIFCSTGQYIEDCGLPETYNPKTGVRAKFECRPPFTFGPVTENICGIVPRSYGDLTLSIPVLYKGILYTGTIEVTAGPNN